ncbi:MAG: hypothetical protein RLW61_06010 [Gammaproteobacteria bacterium]
MNTTALFVELLVIGFGVGFWLILLVIAAFGFDGFDASGSTLIFTALPSLATLYVLGIVWDRIADALFQRFWGDALRAAYFEDIADYYHARRIIFTNSEGLSNVLEYGRSRLRICRGWCLNAPLIGMGAELALYVRFPTTPGAPQMALAIAVASAALTIGCWYAWRQLATAEYRKVRVQAQFLDPGAAPAETQSSIA